MTSIGDYIAAHDADDQAREELLTATMQKLGQVTAERDALAEQVAYCEANHGTEDPDPEPSIRDLVGVRIFPHYSTKTYGRHEALFSWLQDLGIQRVTGLLDHDMADAFGFQSRARGLAVAVKTLAAEARRSKARYERLAASQPGTNQGQGSEE